MKKVLLSAYACLPNQGSEEGTGWTYATTLSQNDLTVHCLTQLKGEAVITPMLQYFPNLTVHYVTLPAWVEKAYHKGLPGMYFHYLYWQWKASQLARQLDKRHQFDIVHHITYGSLQLGSFMYRLGKPFIFGPVSGGQQAPASMKQYFGAYWQREQMRTWVSKLLEHVNPGFYKTLRQASRVIVTNADTDALARRYRPVQPIERMLDGGISLSFVPETLVEHPPGAVLKLLWVGRMLPRKALELTIQALGKVNPDLPVELTIVGGRGDLVDQVPHYIEKYRVDNRVNWVGHVTHDEVKQYYRQSDVFFFTSLRDSGSHQLLEAMAYSLPVVTLDLHGQAELVNDGSGIRVPVTDPETVSDQLARAIEWMAAHPTERLTMGRQAHKFALTQLWETKIRLFVDEWYPAMLLPEGEERMVSEQVRNTIGAYTSNDKLMDS
ncbi:glycosyltransferase family 4 protein [Spirosoma validum]|uniref:Glycosyltransferase family 4 protein n=1 Tax=Spirosoma validum TaxID=2771355 RepID=A0A927GCB6_9BACT|nr:glycosyltransferase family 4 protein [Spirosoma validum]MBD2752291.1 glycosyltransferase family 4 protein [Spirosoma validum]